MTDVRARIIVSGRVQKVGYRDFVDKSADILDLKGVVRNLKDGRVEIICEGPRKTIEKFARVINVHQWPIKVKAVDVRYEKATGEFEYFEPEQESNLEIANAERLGLGIRMLGNLDETMKTMNTSLGFKMDKMNVSLGAKMDKNLQATQSVGEKVDLMRSEVAGSFTRMEEKYGEIGRDLNEAVRLLARAVDKFERRSGQ